MNKTIRRALLGTALLLTGLAASANTSYISSSSGYMLNQSGGGAVTAEWRGQSPIQGFSGYGQIHMNGACLTAKGENQQLRFEGCRGGDKSQIWALSGGKLNNEQGWCADVQGGRGGANVPVIAYKCNGGSNQRWNGHGAQTAQSVASRIGNAQARTAFLQSAQTAPAGSVISTTTGKVIATGGGNVIAPGGGNVIAVGGGNVVASGGGN